MKGKFGRVLGDFVADDGRMITDILIEEGYAVAYHGQSKDDVQEAHLLNRDKLLQEGIVLQSDIDKINNK
jgi:endonuclease YncB( thermonuclease family)